jgi:hypothetical protein
MTRQFDRKWVVNSSSDNTIQCVHQVCTGAMMAVNDDFTINWRLAYANPLPHSTSFSGKTSGESDSTHLQSSDIIDEQL